MLDVGGAGAGVGAESDRGAGATEDVDHGRLRGGRCRKPEDESLGLVEQGARRRRVVPERASHDRHRRPREDAQRFGELAIVRGRRV